MSKFLFWMGLMMVVAYYSMGIYFSVPSGMVSGAAVGGWLAGLGYSGMRHEREKAKSVEKAQPEEKSG